MDLGTSGMGLSRFTQRSIPRRARSTPFASPVSIGRISTLSAWWIQHGVTPELIQPGKPQQNGRHERMHRTLKREATRPPRAHLTAQQRAFNRFRRTFNNERPHQALEQRTPASVYRPSDVAFVDPPPSTTYPDHFEVRHVSQLGMIRWKSRFIWVSKVLTHQDVGLEEVGEGLWPSTSGLADSAGSMRRRTASWMSDSTGGCSTHPPTCKPSTENLL
jgi:hypothetical protein